ncbi:podocalyxin isoform X2 [Gallus gallus]|uniref:podocalyxin isoform X2 n=1 Tax=Gallus gallus TaxID=9031 RepID=UPI000240B1CE|nr:podocalyxin isoform X2 [Gallus gallus]XP_046762673.1 podocalyxin isoform X2 [Gallus gallus]|eukprot:XP_015144998.1 podocalyxin isoform X2 [Gallus gallus]
MRAPLLLPLLPLLLFGVSSGNNDKTTHSTTVSPETTKQITTITVTTSQVQGSISASKPSSTAPTAVMSFTKAQEAATSSKQHDSSTSSIPPPSTSITPSIITTSPQGKTPSTPALTHTPDQNTKTTGRQDDTSHVSVASTSASQQVSSSASAAVPTTTSAVTSSATQQKVSPTDSSEILLKPSASPNSTQVTSPSRTPKGFLSTVTTSPHIADNGSTALNQLKSTVSSSEVPVSSFLDKDHSVSSSTSATNQHLSLSSHRPTSPVPKFECSTPHSGSVPSTSSKTSLSSPSSSTKNATVTTTMTTAKAAYTSQGDGSVTHKSGVTAQSPTSAPLPTPTLKDHMKSKSPDQTHSNVSPPNEVICEDQIGEVRPILNLKEEKTCDDWKKASNEAFFEVFCSGRRHAFNSTRDRCTVKLASSNHRRWAVHVIVHRVLDPAAVFEELKEKRNELEKLGITNVTYLNQEMEEEIKDQFSTPLIITIVTLAGSLLLIAAIYGCCHQRFSQKKSQHFHPDLPGFDDGRAILIFNRLTEELQTMENGYHDNPTLEVMETGSEMQEKKVNLNGELGDSWIVPLDTIMKEDLEEEDTHL